MDGHSVSLWNRKLFESLGIDPGELAGKAEALRKEGQTVMFVATDGKAAGLLGVADPVKGTTLEAAAMSFSSVSVVGNALRLRRKNL